MSHYSNLSTCSTITIFCAYHDLGNASFGEVLGEVGVWLAAGRVALDAERRQVQHRALRPSHRHVVLIRSHRVVQVFTLQEKPTQLTKFLPCKITTDANTTLNSICRKQSSVIFKTSKANCSPGYKQPSKLTSTGRIFEKCWPWCLWHHVKGASRICTHLDVYDVMCEGPIGSILTLMSMMSSEKGQ